MFKDKKNKDTEPIYQLNISPEKAPDCRFCAYYWNNRRDLDYRKTYHDGWWLETTTFNEDGSEKSFSRVSTFKHGCKYFDIIIPNSQMPSLFIQGIIGSHCPMDLSSITGKSISEKKEKIKLILDEHDIDISI